MPPENGLPNRITLIGRGVPANYELSVDGSLEIVGGDPLAEATIVSEQTAEGAIETGIQRFHFSGEMANVRLVDWNGVPAPKSSSTPTVHVNFGVSAER